MHRSRVLGFHIRRASLTGVAKIPLTFRHLGPELIPKTDLLNPKPLNPKP